jgi:hypothetical protein
VLTLVALLAAALAGDDAYQACCTEVEAGLCPTFVEVLGPDTVTARTPAPTSVSGMWALTCQDGAAWFPAARRRVGPSTEPGQVLTSLNDRAAACFAASCNLPVRLCMRTEDDTTKVVDCDTGAPAGRDAWLDSRLGPATPVVSGRRIIRATEVRADRERVVPTQVVATPATPEPVSRPEPTPEPVRTATKPASTPVATRTATPPPRSTAVASRPRETKSAVLDVSLPPAPPTPCVVQPQLRQPSIDQVELGDEASIRGDVNAAVGHYRAAITINVCNAFAWAQLGTSLLDANADDPASEALDYATRLMPQHFRAWTDLGRVREKLGQYTGAIEAYQEALTLRPGYVPAEAGLRRSIRSR